MGSRTSAGFIENMKKGKPITYQCAHCKKEDGGPWSGEALLSVRRYVHSDCWPEYFRLSKVSQAQMQKLNDVFGKIFG